MDEQDIPGRSRTIDEAHDLSVARTLHRIDAARWLGRSQSVFWCEWSHPGEGPRTFGNIVDDLVHQNWEKVIDPGSTCIDIGAHSGDTAIPMGLFSFDRSNGKRGVVYAVELNPTLAGILALNLSLNNDVAEFHLSPFAITAIDIDAVELADHGNSNCNGGILAGDFSPELQERLNEMAVIKYTAPGVSLNTLVKKMPDHHAKNVRFIKIDCEGYDKEILRGAKSFLMQVQPKLMIEWFAWFTPEDDHDLFSAIDEIGYRAFNPWTMEPVDADGIRVPDVLCLPKLG